MQIEISGKTFPLPKYTEGYSSTKFNDSLIRSITYRGNGNDISTSSDQRVLERLNRDPRRLEYIVAALERGVDGFHNPYCYLISHLADSIAQDKDVVEMKIKKGQESNVGDPFKQVGMSLEKGTIHVKNDVGEIRSLSGGTIAVEGNVKKINQARSGVVYVDGNVDELRETSGEIVMVSRELKRYIQPSRSRGGMGRETTASPFVFTSHEVAIEGADDNGKTLSSAREVPVVLSPTKVYDEGALNGLNIDDVRRTAILLAQNRFKEYGELLVQKAAEIDNPTALSRLANRSIQGYITGLARGFYSYIDQRPFSVDDN